MVHVTDNPKGTRESVAESKLQLLLYSETLTTLRTLTQKPSMGLTVLRPDGLPFHIDRFLEYTRRALSADATVLMYNAALDDSCRYNWELSTRHTST